MKTFNQKDIDEKFKSFKVFSVEDVQKVMDNEKKITVLSENKELRKYLDDIKLYFQLLHDFFSGQYKKIPVGTIAAIVGSLLYIFLPVDLIPDCIPVVGFLDDAAVLTACLNATRFDIEEYKKHKENAEAKENFFRKNHKYCQFFDV